MKASKLLIGMLLGAALVLVGAAGAQTYYMFHPGGALSGSWNSQNVNLTNDTYLAGPLDTLTGGTGANCTPTDGQLLIGSTAGGNFGCASLTAGSNITLTPGSHTLQITATGGSSCGSMQTFSPALTGFTSPPTGTLDYWICGSLAIIFAPSPISGTSSSPGMTITNLPSALQPATISTTCITIGLNDSLVTSFQWNLNTGSATVHFDTNTINATTGFSYSATGFAMTNTKGFGGGETCIYPLF